VRDVSRRSAMPSLLVRWICSSMWMARSRVDRRYRLDARRRWGDNELVCLAHGSRLSSHEVRNAYRLMLPLSCANHKQTDDRLCCNLARTNSLSIFPTFCS
jgi:hypothetical protein